MSADFMMDIDSMIVSLWFYSILVKICAMTCSRIESEIPSKKLASSSCCVLLCYTVE